MRFLNRQNKQKGFTLVEAVVVLAIVGIGAAFAYSTLTFVERVRVESQVDDVANFLNRARTEALRSGRRIVICAAKGPDVPSKEKASEATNNANWECDIAAGVFDFKKHDSESWAKNGLISYYADDVGGAAVSAKTKNQLFLGFKPENLYETYAYTGYLDGAGAGMSSKEGDFFSTPFSRDPEWNGPITKESSASTRLVFDTDGSVFNFGIYPDDTDVNDFRGFELLLKRATSKYDDYSASAKDESAFKQNGLCYRIIVQRSGKVDTCRTKTSAYDSKGESSGWVTTKIDTCSCQYKVSSRSKYM